MFGSLLGYIEPGPVHPAVPGAGPAPRRPNTIFEIIIISSSIIIIVSDNYDNRNCNNNKSS